jgi:hypothetical protein
MLWDMKLSDFEGESITEQGVLTRYVKEYGQERATTVYEDMVTDHLSVGGTSNWLRTENRGFFAALLCFCPGGLTDTYPEINGYIHLARHLGELAELQSRILPAIESLPENDQEYVFSRGQDPIELLTSLRLVDTRRLLLPQIQAGLRCFTESALEPWTPSQEPNPDVAEAFGLTPGCLPARV